LFAQDIQAHKLGELAVATSDTVEHDIATVGEEIAVFNLCTDTTRHMNGIVTNMHPAEGVWLFRQEVARNSQRLIPHSEREQKHR
jgi:hypothetical protein